VEREDIENVFDGNEINMKLNAIDVKNLSGSEVIANGKLVLLTNQDRFNELINERFSILLTGSILIKL
jgi:hypothetical protein